MPKHLCIFVQAMTIYEFRDALIPFCLAFRDQADGTNLNFHYNATTQLAIFQVTTNSYINLDVAAAFAKELGDPYIFTNDCTSEPLCSMVYIVPTNAQPRDQLDAVRDLFASCDPNSGWFGHIVGFLAPGFIRAVVYSSTPLDQKNLEKILKDNNLAHPAYFYSSYGE